MTDEPKHQHDPAVYDDGTQVQFLLPRAQPLGIPRHDLPIAALACLCTTCGAFYVAKDDERDWGVRIPRG